MAGSTYMKLNGPLIHSRVRSEDKAFELVTKYDFDDHRVSEQSNWFVLTISDRDDHPVQDFDKNMVLTKYEHTHCNTLIISLFFSF